MSMIATDNEPRALNHHCETCQVCVSTASVIIVLGVLIEKHLTGLTH